MSERSVRGQLPEIGHECLARGHHSCPDEVQGWRLARHTLILRRELYAAVAGDEPLTLRSLWQVSNDIVYLCAPEIQAHVYDLLDRLFNKQDTAAYAMVMQQEAYDPQRE